MKKMKKLLVCLMACATMCMAVGCGSDEPEIPGAQTADDGRTYGGTLEGSMGEDLTNSFFTYNLIEAKEYETYMINGEEWEPDDGYTYIVCKVEVTNIMEDSIPMFISDFEIYWNGDSDLTDYGYGVDDIGDDTFMESQYYLASGESVTKNILFVVPEADSYTFMYQEYWDDDFVGNKFIVNFTPEQAQ